MAELQELKVKVTAEIGDLTRQLNAGGISLAKFGKETEALGKKLGTGGIKQGADQAGQSLTNLGRIAQDAPFGFIGIQNNINPLIESFGALRKETGSNVGAFKALGASLMGAGGIGLAVSVATGLLTVLAQQGFFKTAEAADEAAEAAKEYKKEIDGIFQGVAKEAAEVAGLIGVLNSETAARERKLDALKELQRINPDVFSGLKLEGNLVSGLDVAYQNYIQNLRTVIAVKMKQRDLEKVTEDILKREGATLDRTTRLALESYKKIADAQKTIRQDKEELSIGDIKNQASARELVGLYDRQKGLLQDITDLQKGVKVADSFKPPKEAKTKVKVKADVEYTFNKIEAETRLGGAISRMEIPPVKIPSELQFFIPTGVDKSFLKEPLDQAIKEMEAFDKTLNEIVRGTLTDSFSQIGVIIGDVINGGDIGASFKSLLGIITAGLEAMGKAMIAAGTAKIALESFESVPGVGTVVAGISTIALAQILKNSLPKFAAGGIATQATMGIFGEAGAEAIIPLDRLNEFIDSNGGGQPIVMDVLLRGSDLLLAQDRAAQRRRRNT